MQQAANDFPWYALQIMARREKLIASALCSKGYEVFLPLYTCRRRWSDRVKEMQFPLFPGYLFCRFDLYHRLPILKTPGVMQVVRTCGSFDPVDDGEIAAIQAIVLSRLEAQPFPFLQIGQRVCIERGPLQGLEGILVESKMAFRLVVSVTLLQRSVAVEIDHDWVSPAGPPPGKSNIPARGLAGDHLVARQMDLKVPGRNPNSPERFSPLPTAASPPLMRT